ncbi:hypothetical protein ACFQ1M_00695 [Sungkyunkwania multivorans]|uniref:Uncharacterized protein n=1 Tax=Sungkyunkwania multivorans TaxID=1173618 RepID=A0ABW3CUL0_9FLAO
MQNTQNFYSLKFSGANCHYSLLVNDMPVFHFFDRGIMATRFPINHLILKSGEQAVKIQVYPQSEEYLSRGSRLEVMVEESSGNNYEITEIIAGHKTPSFEKKEKFYEYSFTFDAQVPYELPGWSKSEILKYPEKTFPKIVEHYRYLHAVLKNKRFDQFYELLEKKNQEFDIAYNSDSETSRKEWLQVIDQIEDSKMQLADFPEDLDVQYYANGRVVALFQKNFKPVLFFENKEEGTTYDMYLYLQKVPKEMRFEIIR